jgi:hypothetical protein
LPAELDVVKVLRVNNSHRRELYEARRARIYNDLWRTFGTPPDGAATHTATLTAQTLPAAMRKELWPAVNETYLWHGTSPKALMSIMDQGFRRSLAGSQNGCMFGPGIYFAECSSKADTYAAEEASGLYRGCCALILSRVTLGIARSIKNVYVTGRDVERARSTGAHTIIGDRQAAVGTYREFVVFEDSSCYPEFVVIYRRKHRD